MNRENERALKQIDREIDVENTKSAIAYSALFFLFAFAMIFYWAFAGY